MKQLCTSAKQYLTAVIKLVTKKITILFYDVNKQLFSFKNQENGTMKLNSVSAKKLRGAPEFHTVIHVWLERPWVAAQVNAAIAAAHLALGSMNFIQKCDKNELEFRMSKGI